MLRIKAADLPIASITMISFSLCIWGAITNDLEILTWSCLLIWAHNLLYGFRQIKRNIVFIAFHITFFLFLLSSLLSNIIYEGKVVVLPQNTYSVTTLLLLYTSLLVCYIGYRMLPNHRGKAASENNDDSTFVDTFRIICVIAFYFTVCFNIYCTLRTIQLADLHGYKAIYIKSVGVPSIIAALGKVNDDAFFCLCASMPTKKQFRLPSIVFLLEDAMYLRTGARADFVLAVCFVGIYYVLRNNETTERWIGHKEKILAAVILPVLIVSMVTIGETRIGNEYDYDRSTVAYEIMGQGGSVKVLYYQQIFKDEDCMQQGFTFGAIWKIFCQNIIAKKVFGMPNYGVQSVASAYHAHNLSLIHI